MQTFLIVVAGVVVGLMLFAALALRWVKGKIGDVCDSIVQLVKAGGIPPFRIRLEPSANTEWQNEDAIQTASNQLERAGYARAGEFEVRALEGVKLRAFWHRESSFFAALYDHPHAGVFADVFREYDDGTSVTVTTAPETGLDQPSHALSFRVDGQIVEDGVALALHERLQHESIGRTGYATRPEDFEQVFTEGYAQVMDWRIARGGVTRAEIERVVALAEEEEPPTDASIEMIQAMWRGAIAGFIEEEVQRIWLADSSLGAVEWEALRDRVTVIHEKGDDDDWIESLAWAIAEDEVGDPEDDCACEAAHERALEHIRPIFASHSVRDAFAEAQALLPEKKRFERLGAVEEPWPADVWAAPVEPDF